MTEPLLETDPTRYRTFDINGVKLRLRPVLPGDESIIAQGFARLSPASRYQRFFQSKQELTADELEYFTHIDDIHHVAIGAGLLDENGDEVEGIGVARFVRFQQDMCHAEFAITVVDGWQKLGVGTLLFEEMMRIAKLKGVEALYGYILNNNKGMRRLINKVTDKAIFRHEGPVLEVVIPLVTDKHRFFFQPIKFKLGKKLSHRLRGNPRKKAQTNATSQNQS